MKGLIAVLKVFAQQLIEKLAKMEEIGLNKLITQAIK